MFVGLDFDRRTAPPDPTAGRALGEYAAAFREVFPRADQFRWFTAYLHGLVAAGPRKTIEAIARGLPHAPAPPSADPAQALQNFVSHSPWSHRRLLARYRALLDPPTPEPAGVWAVHDGVFLKRGRHSVGVQRQFARPLGRKVNCQVEVVVARLAPGGYLPLALRLYLPRGWLRDRADPKLPEAVRQPFAKAEIAEELLAELFAEGRRPESLVADDAYRADAGLSGLLESHGVPAAAGALDEADAAFESLKASLGLDHFEGRSWLGWHHHVALVLSAYGSTLWRPHLGGHI